MRVTRRNPLVFSVVLLRLSITPRLSPNSPRPAVGPACVPPHLSTRPPDAPPLSPARGAAYDNSRQPRTATGRHLRTKQQKRSSASQPPTTASMHNTRPDSYQRSPQKERHAQPTLTQPRHAHAALPITRSNNKQKAFAYHNSRPAQPKLPDELSHTRAQASHRSPAAITSKKHSPNTKAATIRNNPTLTAKASVLTRIN